MKKKVLVGLLMVCVVMLMTSFAQATEWQLTDKIGNAHFASDLGSNAAPWEPYYGYSWTVYDYKGLAHQGAFDTRPFWDMGDGTDSCTSSGLKQTVSELLPNTDYKLTFDFTENGGDGTFAAAMGVTDGGNQLARYDFIGNDYGTKSLEFNTGSLSSVLLDFYSWGDNTYLLIDDVKLYQAVPEPATVGLLLMGGLFGLRKKS
jgi:hypothetical protein